MKILNKNNIYKKNEKEYVVFKTFHNVVDLGNNNYLTYLNAEEIGRMWEKEELCYYVPTQRGIKFRKVNNKIKEDVIVKQSNINEMQNLILKGELGTTQLTLNVLNSDKVLLNYNKDKKELFVKGSIALLDGMHRVKSCYKAYKASQILGDKELIKNVNNTIFPILITHYEDSKAKIVFSQMSKGLKISKSLAESFDSTKASNRIISRLNENSVLKGLVEVRKNSINKNDMNHIVTFNTLKIAMDEFFPAIKDTNEEQEIYMFLSSFFNELFNLFPFMKNEEERVLIREESLECENVMFYGYISIASDLYLKRKSSKWKEELKALEKINFDKSNEIWDCIIKEGKESYITINTKSSRALMVRTLKQEFYNNL